MILRADEKELLYNKNKYKNIRKGEAQQIKGSDKRILITLLIFNMF